MDSLEYSRKAINVMTQPCATNEIMANAIAIGQVYAILALVAAIKETDFAPQVNVGENLGNP